MMTSACQKADPTLDEPVEIDQAPTADDRIETADGTLSGVEAGDALGKSIAALGDVTGDGLSDLLVGAPESDWGAYQAGASYLF